MNKKITKTSYLDMKGYIEITQDCELIQYTESDIQRVETWYDTYNERVYRCIWLPQNDGTLPSTIERRHIDESDYAVE